MKKPLFVFATMIAAATLSVSCDKDTNHEPQPTIPVLTLSLDEIVGFHDGFQPDGIRLMTYSRNPEDRVPIAEGTLLNDGFSLTFPVSIPVDYLYSAADKFPGADPGIGIYIVGYGESAIPMLRQESTDTDYLIHYVHSRDSFYIIYSTGDFSLMDTSGGNTYSLIIRKGWNSYVELYNEGSDTYTYTNTTNIDFSKWVWVASPLVIVE